MSHEPDLTRLYAGVLGKLIGVYFGRPVEGWSYQGIRERFGEVEWYPSGSLGVPLVIPDDDISGTFVFLRAILDSGREPSASDVADAWLNYLIEGKTVLWWGGLARSTEHTAYLRLRDGVRPPRSGSVELNGRSMAEGVGGEIFIDGWGLVCPGEPRRAARLARAAASVSHGGLGVESATLIAAMESLAFLERDPHRLIEAALPLTNDPRLTRLVEDVVDRCGGAGDWREVRDWIEAKHGYHLYPGNSPAATNLASVLMSVLSAGDSFARSLTIVTSAGWDTDSNAGNVGCLNGVRLGLDALTAEIDLRSPIADRAYLVSADGGECLTDAVRITHDVADSIRVVRGESLPAPRPRFTFDLPGARQGWRPWNDPVHGDGLVELDCHGDGLELRYRVAAGARGAIALETCAPPAPIAVRGTSMFEVVASPSLYPTQIVRVGLRSDRSDIEVRFFVASHSDDGEVHVHRGLPQAVPAGASSLEWEVPQTNGEAVYQLGLEFGARRPTAGTVTVLHVDWSGAPRDFVLGRADELSPTLTPWTTETAWLRTFVSSARNLAPDYTTTFVVSHPEANGVVTTGTRDWADYEVSSRLTFNMNDAAGLVARARGHRRFYAGIIRGAAAQIVRRLDGVETVLASRSIPHEVDDLHDLRFIADGDLLTLKIDEDVELSARDLSLRSGGAGFLVDRGAMLANGFRVKGC